MAFYFHILLTINNNRTKVYLKLNIKRDQLKGIRKKDAITIYDQDQVQDPTLLRENKPMRDEIWFKSETKQRQVHVPLKAVPHRFDQFLIFFF